jgi:threonyl-tRNA synthetase
MKQIDGVDEDLHKFRHSLAHVLAMAILEMRPGTKLGFGPPIADGFYYDFILSAPLSETDFPEIEKRMRAIIKDGKLFKREDLPAADALKRIDEMGEPYKREYAKDLIEKNGLETLSFYRTGTFVDMCEGPHVEKAKDIPRDAFKIRSLAGAYWRGDSKNQMMTRIYAWAFKTKEELDSHVKAYLEAQERDHRKLGKDLDIFHIDDEIGKGLPLWLPNGTVIRDEFEKLMKELEFKGRYQRVATPHITKTDLYYRTGHLPYYAEGMFPFMELKEKREGPDGTVTEVKESYVLKPMNCPHHHKIFASRLRSYRDLPLRLAEYGQVYRYEESGGLAGLLRVRGMCMNDAHIYCTEEQAVDELVATIELQKEVYRILDIKEYSLRFSTWDPEDPKGKEKYIDDPAGWERSQKLVFKAIERSGLPWREGKGEAAFYGPKIDFQFKAVTGREETASTTQLDFGVGKRLNLVYKGADNQEHTPYIIHRAPLGTHERFGAFAIEHFAGAFPTWLAPLQVRLVPIAQEPAMVEYCHKLEERLRHQMVRVDIDDSTDTFNKRVRNAVVAKIPNVLIVGGNEVAENAVMLRRYSKERQEKMSVDQFEAWVLEQIRTRALNGA